MPTAPQLPAEMLLRYTDVPEGRVRTRVLGERRHGVPPVVVIQGMAVSDYLLPACAALGEWTQVARRVAAAGVPGKVEQVPSRASRLR